MKVMRRVQERWPQWRGKDPGSTLGGREALKEERGTTGLSRSLGYWPLPSLGLPFQPFLSRQQSHYVGETVKQIGQQARDLCGVGTAPVSLTVYPAVFFRPEISMRGTTTVNYGLWLEGSQGRLCQSAAHQTAPFQLCPGGKGGPGQAL